jgi:hypothetical protein
MAKKQAASGNKSQAIRDALAAHPDKSPKDIAEMLSAQGYKLNAQYVSTIKSNANKKVRKVRVKKAGPKVRIFSPQTADNGFGAAVEFIQACGGLDRAKEVLAAVEQLKAVI